MELARAPMIRTWSNITVMGEAVHHGNTMALYDFRITKTPLDRVRVGQPGDSRRRQRYDNESTEDKKIHTTNAKHLLTAFASSRHFDGDILRKQKKKKKKESTATSRTSLWPKSRGGSSPSRSDGVKKNEKVRLHCSCPQTKC